MAYPNLSRDIKNEYFWRPYLVGLLTHYKRRILQKYADALQVASQFYVVFVKVLIGLVLPESAFTLALKVL